ncbi:MAG: TlpA disulfide reductase family protein [Chitinophagaceae bacterium]|jgi:thiol-disulfide isomerase/thioredoxin
MKKIFSALLFCCAISLSASAQYENTKIIVGAKAPELAFEDPAGKKLVLSEINKGRVILLDFWASWCGPCRRSNPALVKLYNDYKKKSFKGAKNGFTVVSVSLDKAKEAWMQAITADKLEWPYHMSDLGAWQSKAAEIYGIQYVPQAFLIGADGKILAKYMSAEEAVADLNKLVK